MYGDYEIKNNNVYTNTTYNTNTDTKKQVSVSIPIGQNHDKKDNLNEPVAGYYIERTTENKEEKDITLEVTDDEPEKKTKKKAPITLDNNDEDHDINPNIKIHTHTSIAKRQGSNEVTDALNDAVYSDLNDNDNGAGAHMVEAMQMLDDDNHSSDILKNAPKGLNIFAKPTVEFSSCKIDSNIIGKSKTNTSAYSLDAGGTWSSKKNKTHAAFFVSGSKTIDHTKIEGIQYTNTEENIDDSNFISDNISTEQNGEIADSPNTLDDLDTIEKTTDFKGFVALEHTFSNKDEVFGYASYKYDASDGDATNIGARYMSNKYGAYAQANVHIYKEKPSDQELEEDPNGRTNSVVANIKVGFNNDATDVYENLLPNNNTATSVTPQENNVADNLQENKADNSNGKKWKKYSNPFITTESINNNLENGLGYEQIYTKSSDYSALALGYFGKGSITHEFNDKGKKTESYNVTFGGNLKYKGYAGNGILEASAKVRNKYTIGKENIFTTQGNVSYIADKFSAGVDAVYTKIPSSTYKGIVGRVEYNPKDNIKLCAEADYIDWQRPEGHVKGVAAQLSALLNF